MAAKEVVDLEPTTGAGSCFDIQRTDIPRPNAMDCTSCFTSSLNSAAPAVVHGFREELQSEFILRQEQQASEWCLKIPGVALTH